VVILSCAAVVLAEAEEGAGVLRMVGPCGLCLQTKELQKSHLLGAAFYKLSREEGAASDPNPVVVTRSRALTSSKQVVSPFLCGTCEQLFSHNGENYVSAQCAQPNGQFKLREQLQAASPLYVNKALQFEVYDVKPILRDKVEQYLYFAASVFWRASAHDWRMGQERSGQIGLGVEYQEQFRLYLLGKAAFPQNARVFVHVSSETQPDMTTVFPCTFRLDKARRHKFYVPGVLFILFLGSDVPRLHDGGALNGTKQQCMWLCPLQNDSLFRGILKLVGGATPTGKLHRRG
jgi:hypothetical protein